jgi:rfaE bifunctional protein kinase chain/domain
VGDLIIDEYINCHPLGMSREEPTVVVTPVDSQKFLGGAGIVAAHTVGLGATTTLISIIGNDEVGRWSEEKLDEYGVLFQPIKDKNHPTNLKQRYRSGSQTLFKISHLNQDKTKVTIEKEIITKFEALAPEIDLLILSDFSYGVFNKHTTEALISIAKKNGVFVSADSQTSSQIGDLTQFAGVDLITPTEIEARYELKDNVSGLAVIVENLRQKINPKHIILKLGADGMVFTGTNRNGQLSILDALPSLNNSPVDVSGAGDSLLAAASLALTAEENLSQAALLGSISAAMQVARVGNIPIQVENLRSFLK